ncbi:polyprenyl synthetase family protein [Legionella jamestowniensis]|uniref:Geranyl transferase n=1 Tax=Legionella jamestowniensis TaxID=455 RepID=A0A0W0ULH2_9GAMM|nr:polyprenyl synthetase family protein [Legionella jamestowniensis]KTD08486.1 geranyltranstransferase [Legionella jamestowniensis]OCH97049.1 geranyl transferase [Legionella jamestowniensis]SFL51812.1 farnesyl diphosphate synthase [Legionella jamestowniensis DSM 19215]
MINQTMGQYLTHFEIIFSQIVSQADIPASRIREATLYSLFPGGKRLRPLLVYLCGEVTGVQQGTLDTIATAIELIHCYSLVHDDLPAMDNDDFRRGKPSCHKAFDEATAILVGDGLQALAVEVLLTYLPQHLTLSQVKNITHELIRASGFAGMVSGQGLDLSELANTEISESRLRFIHSLKTGQLISACFNMVLAASQVSKETTDALADFATQLGLVYQMQDDYLDYYAENDGLGKGRASDAANNKVTFATLYDKTALLTLITNHFQQAKAALSPLGDKADNLLALTNYIQRRSSHH